MRTKDSRLTELIEKLNERNRKIEEMRAEEKLNQEVKKIFYELNLFYFSYSLK